MNNSFLQNIYLNPLLIITKNINITISNTYKHNKTSIFYTKPYKSYKIKIILKQKKNKTINNTTTNNQSKYSKHYLTIPQLPKHPKLHIH